MMLNRAALIKPKFLNIKQGMPLRSYHSIARPAASVIATEKPVLVYNSKEFADLQAVTENENQNFESGLNGTAHKSKVYSLLPFLFEAGFTNKSFVLRLQLYPDSKLLQFDTLQFDGVETFYVPVEQIIPITKYDYQCAASWRPFFKQN